MKINCSWNLKYNNNYDRRLTNCSKINNFNKMNIKNNK